MHQVLASYIDASRNTIHIERPPDKSTCLSYDSNGRPSAPSTTTSTLITAPTFFTTYKHHGFEVIDEQLQRMRRSTRANMYIPPPPTTSDEQVDRTANPGWPPLGPIHSKPLPELRHKPASNQPIPQPFHNILVIDKPHYHLARSALEMESCIAPIQRPPEYERESGERATGEEQGQSTPRIPVTELVDEARIAQQHGFPSTHPSSSPSRLPHQPQSSSASPPHRKPRRVRRRRRLSQRQRQSLGRRSPLQGRAMQRKNSTGKWGNPAAEMAR